MSDQTNSTAPIPIPEEEEITDAEKEVHGEWMKDKISEQDVEEIDTIPELEQEAEKIKLEEAPATMAAPVATQAPELPSAPVELPPQVEAKQEVPSAASAPIIPEAQIEAKQEAVAEPKIEVVAEAPSEVKSEISKL